LASSVISASAVSSNDSRQAWMMAAISSGSSIDGVPPPKKMVSAGVPRARSGSRGTPPRRTRPSAPLEQAAVEVAVVADGGAERDVDVEPEHDRS
jgi:hypothetical protein